MVATFLAVLGLIFGSFVNALVWRLHEQAELEGRKGAAASKRRRALSIMRGRSMCPDCGHELAGKDLVPVFSWLWLRGRCRYCRQPISWQYPVVEVLTGAAFLVSYLAWPYELDGAGIFRLLVWLSLLVMFMALAVYDVRWLLLPDRIVAPVTVLAVMQTVIVAIWRHDASQLWQPLLGAVVIGGLFWLLYQVSKGGWIGGGDVKLAPALGLLAGTPLRAVLIIFIASLIGTVVSLPLLLRSRRGLKLRVPFGPFLLAGTAVVVLWGPSLVDWYQRLILS